MGSEEALKVVSQRRFHCRYGHNEPLCISRQAYSIKGFQVPLQNCKKIQDEFKKSCLFPRKIIVIDDGKGGGCEDTRFCAFLALQRMGEEHLMLQSQKVKV